MATARPFPVTGDAAKEMFRTICEMKAHGGEHFRRKEPRFDLEGQKAVVTIVHPGGSVVSAECALIDISEGGASFLYPGFLHTDTECVMHLETIKGVMGVTPSRSMWCRFVTNPIHLIGIRWEKSIDVRSFVNPTAWLEQMAKSDTHSKGEIEGKVLLMGFDEMEADLVRVILAETKMTFTEVSYDGEALDLLAKSAFDVLVVNADQPDSDTAHLLTQIRQNGVSEPIILVTEQSNMVQALSATPGVTAIGKPYSHDVICGSIRDLLLTQANPLTGTRPIYSELQDQRQKKAPVSTFVQRAKKYSTVIQSTIEYDNTKEATRITLLLRNTAVGFGFPLLEKAASQATMALNASGSASESSTELRSLMRVISRLHDPNDSMR